MKHKRLWARAPISDFARGESFSISTTETACQKRTHTTMEAMRWPLHARTHTHKQQKYVNSMCRHVCAVYLDSRACVRARALNDIPFYWQSFYFAARTGGGGVLFSPHALTWLGGELAEDVRERVCEMRARACAKRFGASDTDRQKGWACAWPGVGVGGWGGGAVGLVNSSP